MARLVAAGLTVQVVVTDPEAPESRVILNLEGAVLCEQRWTLPLRGGWPVQRPKRPGTFWGFERFDVGRQPLPPALLALAW